MIEITCSGSLHLAAACQQCSKYSDPCHVVRTIHIDKYQSQVSTAKVYCERCCPVCQSGKEAP